MVQRVCLSDNDSLDRLRNFEISVINAWIDAKLGLCDILSYTKEQLSEADIHQSTLVA
jgi:hypothetical protein